MARTSAVNVPFLKRVSR